MTEDPKKCESWTNRQVEPDVSVSLFFLVLFLSLLFPLHLESFAELRSDFAQKPKAEFIIASKIPTLLEKQE